jgi:hypothetical protein
VKEDGVEGALFVQQLRTEKQTGNVASAHFEMGAQSPLYHDNSKNMRQLQRTILVETNFFDIYVLNYIFLSSNILSISLYIKARKLKNLNKNTVLTSTESTDRT